MLFGANLGDVAGYRHRCGVGAAWAHVVTAEGGRRHEVDDHGCKTRWIAREWLGSARENRERTVFLALVAVSRGGASGQSREK